jgi:membrane protease YdiL (CAAX protease family)
MSKGGDVATVLAILVAVNLLNNRLLPRAYVLTCVVAAGLLLLLGRWDGCSWTELGFGSRQLESGLRWAGAMVGLVLLADTAVAGVVGAGIAGTAVTVTGATVGAALAGVALCELRRRSGGLLAPFALHWTLNGLGLLFAWASSRASRR